VIINPPPAEPKSGSCLADMRIFCATTGTGFGRKNLDRISELPNILQSTLTRVKESILKCTALTGHPLSTMSWIRPRIGIPRLTDIGCAADQRGTVFVRDEDHSVENSLTNHSVENALTDASSTVKRENPPAGGLVVEDLGARCPACANYPDA